MNTERQTAHAAQADVGEAAGERLEPLTISQQNYRSGGWVSVLFNIIFDLVVLIFLVIAFLTGGWRNTLAPLGVLALLALLWTWHSCKKLRGRTTITLADGYLNFRRDSLWRRTERIPLSQVRKFKITETEHQELANLAGEHADVVTVTRVHIDALLAGGQRLRLLENLEVKPREIRKIKSQLEAFRERHVKGL